eukprot:s2077_g16.t1
MTVLYLDNEAARSAFIQGTAATNAGNFFTQLGDVTSTPIFAAFCSQRSVFDSLSYQSFRFKFAVVAMVRQLVFLTTAVLAILGQPDVSTCGTLFSTDSKCQNDSAALLQVGASNGDSDEPVGPAGPKQQLIEMKAAVITSMNDWHSSRDLARISRVQNVTIAKNCIVQIFSAVPVFGKDETYVALVVEKNGDAYWDHPKRWMQPFDAFVMFCAGPDGSHKTQVIARGHSWVCPWPREEWQTKRFNVVLEDKHGTNLGTVVAEHDPKLLGHLEESQKMEKVRREKIREEKVRRQKMPAREKVLKFSFFGWQLCSCLLSGSHPKIQQLQNPAIDDKIAWLHWTFSNAVARRVVILAWGAKKPRQVAREADAANHNYCVDVLDFEKCCFASADSFEQVDFLPTADDAATELLDVRQEPVDDSGHAVVDVKDDDEAQDDDQTQNAHAGSHDDHLIL